MGTRLPAVAGRFYPRDPAQLRRAVEQYVAGAADQTVVPPSRTSALVVPHAGYVYSGPTAGFGYAHIKGQTPKRVFLTGCSHRFPVERASVYPDGAFQTPLGDFPIDAEMAARVIAVTGTMGAFVHDDEHSLEVQLPFLAEAVGIVPIVPILFGGPAGTWHAEMGRRIAALADDSDLFIASTDLSHYLTEKQANVKDRLTLDAIRSQDIEVVLAGLGNGACAMCGESAVVAAMGYALARNARKWTLLDYRTSGAASGDYDRVVGYAAISLEHA